MKRLLSLFLLLSLPAGAETPAEPVPFEPVLLVVVPGGGRYSYDEIADRVTGPVAERAVPWRGPRPPALEGWRARGSGDPEGTVLSLVPDRPADFSAVPAALAALRGAVEECEPLFPEGIEPSVEVRPAVLRRDRDGNPVANGEPESLFLAELSLRGAADPDGVRPAWTFRPLVGPSGTLLASAAEGADPVPSAVADCRLPASRLAGARWLSSETILLDFGPAGRVAVTRDPATGALSVAVAPADAPPAVGIRRYGRPFAGGSGDPFRERPAAIVAIPCDRPSAALAARLAAPALAAARAALAAALPDAPPVPVSFRSHDLRVANGSRGFAVLAGPLSPRDAIRATNALAAAFAPGAFPLPAECGPARVSRARVGTVPDGSRFRADDRGPFQVAIDAARAEARIDWRPAVPGADPLAALAPGGKFCVALRLDRSGRDDAGFAAQAAEPLLGLARRAASSAAGVSSAGPALGIVPGRGAVLVVPLAADSAAPDAAAAALRDRLGPFAESLPEWVSPPFSGAFSVPPGSADDPAAAGRALVRAVLHAADVATRGNARFLSPENGELRFPRDRDALDDAREAAAGLLPPELGDVILPDDSGRDFALPFLRLPPDVFSPALASAFGDFSRDLGAALREGDAAAFAALLDPSAAAAAPDVAADPFSHPFLAPFARAGAVRAWIDPLDADGLEALRALLLAETSRLDRAFFVVAEVPGDPAGPAPWRPSGALRLPVVSAAPGAPLRILGPAAWSAAFAVRTDAFPAFSNATVRAACRPSVRDVATDELAAAILRSAATGDPAPLLARVHPRFRDGLPGPPEEPDGPEARFFARERALYAAAPRDPASLFAPRVRSLSFFAGQGELSVRFEALSRTRRQFADEVSAFRLRMLGLAPAHSPAPDLRPLAERIPGLWLRALVLLRVPSGREIPVGSFLAVEKDGRCLLVPPMPEEPEAPEDDVRSARLACVRARTEGLVPDFEAALRAAAARLDPPALVDFSYFFSGPFPRFFRQYRNGGSDDGEEEDAEPEDDGSPGRAALRLELVSRSGLGTDLDASSPLPVADLGPGDSFVVHLPESAASGSPSLSHRLLGGERGDACLECRGDGHGARGVPLWTRPALGPHRRRFVADRWEDDAAPPPEALTWVPAVGGRPFRVYGAWFETAGRAAHEAALRAFLADPECAIRRALDGEGTVLHPFVLVLHPDPAAEAAPPDGDAGAGLPSPPGPDAEPFPDLAGARRELAALRFADPSTTSGVDEIDEASPLGPDRRLHVTARLETAPGSGPFPAAELPLRAVATAAVETRESFAAPWRPVAPPLVVERRAVYRVGDDGRVSFEGDVRPAAPWRRSDRDPDLRHAASAPLGEDGSGGRLGLVLSLGLPGPEDAEEGEILLGAEAFLSEPGAPDPFVPGFERLRDRNALAPHRVGHSTHFLNRLRLVPDFR